MSPQGTCDRKVVADQCQLWELNVLGWGAGKAVSVAVAARGMLWKPLQFRITDRAKSNVPG